jgi:hypothetical protein
VTRYDHRSRTTATAATPARRRRVVFGIAVLIAIVGSPLGAQLNVFKKGEKPAPYQTFKDAAGRFTVDYPATNWRILPGAGSLLVGFTQRDGEATVLVDYMRLRVSLAPHEIDNTMAELELETLKERQPAIKDVKATLVPDKSGPRVAITFSRTGPQGREQVVQYSVPSGDNLYRIVCSVRSDRAKNHQSTLAHIADSFKALR